jgi:hypothetical protein
VLCTLLMHAVLVIHVSGALAALQRAYAVNMRGNFIEMSDEASGKQNRGI